MNRFAAMLAAQMIRIALLIRAIFCAIAERNATRPRMLTAATVALAVTLVTSRVFFHPPCRI